MDNRFIQEEDQHYQLPRPSAHKINQLLPKKRRKKWPIIVAVTACVLMATGGGAYFFINKKNQSAQTNANTAEQTTNSDTPAAGQQLKAAIPTETFSSSTLNTSIKHPKGWIATEAGGKATIVSPVSALPATNEQQTSGQITITIQPKQTSLAAFSAGNALAVRDSEKLTYANPSTMQRGQTYISFAHHANSTSSDTSFDGIYVTGDAGYTAQQYITKADVLKGDPLVTVTFAKCPDATCSTPTPLTIPATAWDNPDFSGTIRPILASLVVN